jgi:single-stranded-DNA-specific exonuclease
MNYRWSLAPPQPLLAERLAKELHLSPLLAQCVINRGLTEPGEAAAYLEPRLRKLADPFQLPDMVAAVDRLFAARERAEPLVIFGDYDVDGVTSTALLLEVLRRLGWQVDYYLPHRLDEGYGLSQDGVENCLARFPVKLLLAVDCGSTACAQVEWLRQRGVDVIVLDHHQVSDPPPDAVALVNPNVGCRSPIALDSTLPPSAIHPPPSGRVAPPAALRPPPSGSAALCSVGLAFKLAHALVKRGRQRALAEAQAFDLKPLLDLVALGTIADIVPLTGENRIFVATGLQRLEHTARPGLQALKRVAQVTSPVGPYEVGFQLGPRLNAAGRLETATEALHLLLAPDLVTAEPLARALDTRNRERQQIERTIAEQVIGAVRAKFNPATDYVIVEGQLLWHIGVVGIVASRVLREFYRPTLILGGDGDEWRGSGRSIEGFDLAAALRACDDLLLRHGGHAMAAGLSLRPTNLDALRQRLNELARRSLPAEQLVPALRLDGEVSLAELTVERVTELDRLEPTGQGNPPVQLAIRHLTLKWPPQRMGREQQHAKLWITDGARVAEVVWWNGADQPMPAGRFDLACAPQVNDYNGRRTVQLKLLAWQPGE